MRSAFETVTEEARKSGSNRSAKAALHATLLFVGRHELLVGEASLVQDIGTDDPAGLVHSFLGDLFLVETHRWHNLPLLACWTGVFARTPPALILRMSHQLTVNL